MVVRLDQEAMAKKEAECGDYTPETQIIEEGAHPARLVYYAELGKHYPMFKGARNKYDSGKRTGQLKDAELIIHLVFEFSACAFDNDPLTIETSVPFGNTGEFINKLPVSDALPKMSLSFANKSAYKKYLNSMNEATDCNHGGIDQHLGNGFLIAVTNNVGKPDSDGNSKVYSNMKPEGISKPSFRHPVTKKVEAVPVPESKGTYGPMFDWDAPTEEAWNALKKQYRDCIMRAVNFTGSPVQALLAGMPDQNDEALPQEDGMPDNTPPKNTGKAAEPANDDVPV